MDIDDDDDDLNALNADGRTRLAEAVFQSNGQTDIYKLIRNPACDVNAGKHCPLYYVCLNRKMDLLTELLERHDIDINNTRGPFTPMGAVAKGYKGDSDVRPGYMLAKLAQRPELDIYACGTEGMSGLAAVQRWYPELEHLFAHHVVKHLRTCIAILADGSNVTDVEDVIISFCTVYSK